VTAPMAETDVLVVASGPAGASAALFLAAYGTSTLMITKYSRLSDSPRAHITNQRTMETMRDMGIEDVLMREATPWEYMGNTTFCTSLAGEELGRIPSWGTDTGPASPVPVPAFPHRSTGRSVRARCAVPG
jgi:2,4-dichlorophenol 6-monooxygenase